MARENDKVVGNFPLIQLKSLLFGNFTVSMPYFNYGGIVADTHDIMISSIFSAHEISDELGCSHIEMRFDTELEFELPVRTDKITRMSRFYRSWHISSGQFLTLFLSVPNPNNTRASPLTRCCRHNEFLPNDLVQLLKFGLRHTRENYVVSLAFRGPDRGIQPNY